MLFEIHDIILHRLWKDAAKRFRKFTSKALTDSSASAVIRYCKKYNRLNKWERLTRRWYFNHYHKLHFVFPN